MILSEAPPISDRIPCTTGILYRHCIRFGSETIVYTLARISHIKFFML